MIEYRILGPLEIHSDGQLVPLPTPREQRLLAVLLLSANRPVPLPQLVDALWDDDPPSTARRQVQNCLSRLRQLLHDAGGHSRQLVTAHSGYQLSVDDAHAQLDVHRFQRLCTEAAELSPDAHTRRSQLLRAALALRRGPVLAGLDSPTIQAGAAALEEQCLIVHEQCLDAELAAGRHESLIGELTELLAVHPLRERLVGQHMLALYRSARQAEALQAYQRMAQRLADELGADPGPELRQLHRAVLRHEPPAVAEAPAADETSAASETSAAGESTAGEAAAGHTTGPSAVVPRQLPATGMFVGRGSELTALDGYLTATVPGSPRTVAVSGTAGAGKTALAVRWAHRVCDQFPDGQLYADLRGYGAEQPVGPGQVLEAFLRDLGADPRSIPSDLAARAAWFRTLTADRRVLLLLDNAAGAEQVRPLLPGADSCFVLVTSRDRLSGLVARDGAGRVDLGRLSTDDAEALLRELLGDRGCGESEALTQLIDQCAQLPLALRIAAERLRERRDRTVADLVAELADEARRLDLLAAGADAQASTRAVFSWSYGQLGPRPARAFRLCGLHPGYHLDAHAVAALTGDDLQTTRDVLDTLAGVHLLEEDAAGRYRLHDLLRVYAAELAGAIDSVAQCREAAARLCKYYGQAASAAMDAAYPYERDRRPHTPVGDLAVPDLPNTSAATEWLDAELPNLLAVAQYAADDGQAHRVLHLSGTVHRHLRTRGRYADAESLHTRALEVARATGDRSAERESLAGLGHTYRNRTQYEQAAEYYTRALGVARELPADPAEADALIGLGNVHAMRGDYKRGSDELTQALQLARELGYRPGELAALTALGNVHQRLGWFGQAREHFQQALAIARATGDHPGAVDAQRFVAWSYRLHGQDEHAAAHFAEALPLARATGNRIAELDILRGMGEVHRWQGRYEEAARHHTEAVAIAHAIGNGSGELEGWTSLGHVRRLQGRHDEAAARYRQVYARAVELDERNWQFEALHGLGRLHCATGAARAAESCHQQALAIADELGQLIDQARARDGLGHACHALGWAHDAQKHWQQALDTLTLLGVEHTEDEEATAAAIRAHLADLGR